MFEAEIRELERDVAAMNAAMSRVLKRVGTLDLSGACERAGFGSTAEWLSATYQLTWGTANEWVRVARRLRELPEIARAFEVGMLSWDQVRPLTKFAEPSTDAEWAREAPVWTAGALWREAVRRQEFREVDETRIHEDRYLQVTSNEEQTEFYVQGRCGAAQGTMLRKALRRRAAKLARDPSATHPSGALLMDAMVDVATGTGDGRRDPVLVVHVDENAIDSSLEGRGKLCETDDGAQLSASTAQRIACEALVEIVVEREGLGVGVGFERRRPPAWLERLVRHRDVGRCRFPGCRRRDRLLSHHIRPWPTGSTALDGLLTLCPTHHRSVHEGGWSIRGTPSKGLRFHDPAGRPLVSATERRAQTLAVSALPPVAAG